MSATITISSGLYCDYGITGNTARILYSYLCKNFQKIEELKEYTISIDLIEKLKNDTDLLLNTIKLDKKSVKGKIRNTELCAKLVPSDKYDYFYMINIEYLNNVCKSIVALQRINNCLEWKILIC